jgi:EmrB/QacA subfamily drug resistance transporter
MTTTEVRYGTAAARWVLVATVLASGMVFLDGTVVNIAAPVIGRDLRAGISGIQWVLDGYLVVLSALLLLGGSLGDRYGRRRILRLGLAVFTAASVLCGVAPDLGLLIGARVLEGIGGALLVPGSLAILSAAFAEDDRRRAIGTWSGLSGVASALAPLVGGWLTDAVSWRAIFFINVPLALGTAVALGHVPETRDDEASGPPDLPGALASSAALALAAAGLIERVWWLEGVAAVALVAFVVLEHRSGHPMLPLGLFRSSQFTGANLSTLAVYGALGGFLFVVVLNLELVLGYSPVAAGAALLPITVLMVLLSGPMSQLAQRIGPRLPMTVGPLGVAAGTFLLVRATPGSSYLAGVLPGVVVFGLGLAVTVGPLTGTVLAAVDQRHAGAASGVNNSVARVAGLVMVAVLPVVTHMGTGLTRASIAAGYHEAVVVSAVLAAAGALVAFLTVRAAAPVRPTVASALHQPCQDCEAALARGGPRRVGRGG